MTSSAGSVRLAVSDVHGYSMEEASLVLHCGDGSEVRCFGTAAEIRELATAVKLRLCSLGEVTRSMLSMGTRRGSPGADHNAFFAPLLQAIERARACESPEEIMAEFNGARLMDSMETALKELAGAYHPDAAPERRALTEQLIEEITSVGSVARVLDGEALNFTAHGTRELFATWRRWQAALLRLAMETDGAWLRVLPVLAALPRGRQVPPAPDHPA